MGSEVVSTARSQNGAMAAVATGASGLTTGWLMAPIAMVKMRTVAVCMFLIDLRLDVDQRQDASVGRL